MPYLTVSPNDSILEWDVLLTSPTFGRRPLFRPTCGLCREGLKQSGGAALMGTVHDPVSAVHLHCLVEAGYIVRKIPENPLVIGRDGG